MPPFISAARFRRYRDVNKKGAPPPRATLAVTAMAKSVARLRGRDYVTPADVKEVFAHTIAHRLILSPKAEAQGKQPQAVLQDILAAVPAPRLR